MEQISVVPGRYDILLADSVDLGFVYWGAGNSIFRWSPETKASEVFEVTDLSW